MGKRQAILGRKVGMTQLFTETGEVVPVTIIQAGPCYVTQIKTEATDGYNAIQIGFEHAKRLNKPQRGHLGGLLPLRYLREIRTDDVDQYQLGQVIDVSLFEEGEAVDVAGISKGKGFAGAMKRHHFGGGSITHGQSDRQRSVGSIGAGTTPGRVYKGLRGPGHMGNERVTVLNLKVVKVDPERNLLAIRGAIPGPKDGLVFVRKAAKTQVKRNRRALER
ncbi:MAG: 50S ribosomal protein L3 [Chloroflexi bacterium]|jgi:large subunit ribosomal protein L3|nr:50S ribosomal protein L3 [Chloroflexota bacterium]